MADRTYNGHAVILWDEGADTFSLNGVEFDCREDTVYFVSPHGPYVMSEASYIELTEINDGVQEKVQG